MVSDITHPIVYYVRCNPFWPSAASFFTLKSAPFYLGFHMDPLYHVHWNNLVAPVHYEIRSGGEATMTPATGDGPKVETPYDIDPREFLHEVRNARPNEQLDLDVEYYACNNDEGWCKKISQSYTIFLERDRDGGGVFGRSFGRGRGAGGRRFEDPFAFLDEPSPRNVEPEDRFTDRMLDQIDDMDKNGDGVIDKEEIEAMSKQLSNDP